MTKINVVNDGYYCVRVRLTLHFTSVKVRQVMRAIQNFLPNPRHVEVHRIFVNAKPESAWAVARHFDMSQVPWIRLLFDIRTFPDRMSGKMTSRKKAGLGVDDITANETGFMILHETPGKEVVVGSVGQFWHLNIPFERIHPADFTGFNVHGFGKIAWSISVESYRNGSTVSIELRITATDELSWKKLNRYYQVIGIGSRLIRSSVMARLESILGKMKLPDIDRLTLAGDELLPDAKYGLTHVEDIEAPPPIVWRYLMQLGCDRAGWYSIDALDNGGRISTDHVVNAWELRNVGDKLSASPAGDDFFNVHRVDKPKDFVIGGDQERLGGPFKMTWSFVLEPVGVDACRLITRARMKSTPEWAAWIMGKIVYPALHGLMSKVQLATIKKYAQRDALGRIAKPVAIAA